MKKRKFFVQSCGLRYAGIHLIIEFWDCINLKSVKTIKKCLVAAVNTAGATVLSIKLHKFPNGGVSGVVILSESHLSIHTWPEYSYAALDIFTCGSKAKPYKAIPVLKKYFKPERIQIMEVKRGLFE